MSLWRAARDRIGSIFSSPSNEVLRRLLSDQGAKHWKGYAFAFAMMALIAVTTSLSAWIIGRIVDKIFVGRDLKAVWEITAAIVAIYTVKGMATYGQQVILSRVANSIVASVQRRIFDKMLRMKVGYYSRSHSSEFIARQAFIAQSASNALNLLITTLSRDALTIVGLIIVMVSQDPLLSLFALMFVPLAVVGVRKIGLRVRKIMASEFQGAMQMMESLQETAQGIRIVKAFTLESFMRRRRPILRTRAQRAARTSARRARAAALRHHDDDETDNGQRVARERGDEEIESVAGRLRDEGLAGDEFGRMRAAVVSDLHSQHLVENAPLNTRHDAVGDP